MKIDNKVDVKVDNKVDTEASTASNVTISTKPVNVETKFESKIEISLPQFRVGTSGFNLHLFGLPVFSLEPFSLSTERATEFFGELFFGGEYSRIPSYRITDKCIGCSTCARQCPTGAIYGVMKRRFFINPSQCIKCGTCGRACPVSAIVDPYGNTVQRVKPKDKRVPVVDHDQCSGCEDCVNICPFNCLAIKPSESAETMRGIAFLARPGKCVSCGECERICPQEAISLRLPEQIKKVA